MRPRTGGTPVEPWRHLVAVSLLPVDAAKRGSCSLRPGQGLGERRVRVFGAGPVPEYLSQGPGHEWLLLRVWLLVG